MTPRLRKTLPFVAPLLAGAVGYLLLGQGPSSAPVRAGASADWSLPAVAAPDLAPAEPVWAARAPWGGEVAQEATVDAVAPVRPVGVVAVGDRLFALFTQGEGVVRVPEGGYLADGGQVTAIRPDAVQWVDPAGRPQQRELLVDVVDAAAPADDGAASARQRPTRAGARTGPRGATASPRRAEGAAGNTSSSTRPAGNTPSGPRPAASTVSGPGRTGGETTRPAPAPREPGQRRARTNVPERGSDPFNSTRRPASTDD